MPMFEYLAVGGDGKEVRGRVSADDARAATAELRARRVFVTRIGAAKHADAGEGGLAREIDLSASLSVRPRELMFLFSQLAFILRAGMPVIQALQLARSQTSGGRLKRILAGMQADIAAGASLSQAMAKHPQTFTPLMVNLVLAGESTGDLETIMERIARQVEKRLVLRTQLINALIYPALVVVAAIGVGIFLVWKIIPQFEKFLAGRGRTLPASTQALIDFSHFMRDNGLWILAAAILLAVAVVAAYGTHAGRLRIDAALLRLPVMGKLLTNGAMAQMNWALSAMLKSGLTIRDGLLVTAGVVSNRVVSEKLRASAELILAGRELSGSVRHAAIPDLVTQMIAMGERTGTLDRVLTELGMYYEQALQNGIKRLSALLEPALILVIGGMVGFVYYSFLMAMFRLAGG